MDVIAYLNPDVKARIHDRIKEDLKRLEVRAGQGPVTIISHSLGTVIASDFVYDRQKHQDVQGFQLANFFTMGSPIALFALRYGGPEVFDDPIHMDIPDGEWINILDADDPIAYPLKSLNAVYDQAVSADQEVNTGLFGLSHTRYWKTLAVHQIIAKKLAKDWIKLNS